MDWRKLWRSKEQPQVTQQIIDQYKPDWDELFRLRRVLAAARTLLESDNMGIGLLTSGRLVTTEHVHQLAKDDRCASCGQVWPCGMERLRIAVEAAKQ